MNDNEMTDPRLVGFIQYVKDTEPPEVVQEFMKVVLQQKTCANSNFGMWLDVARQNAPSPAEMRRREQANMQRQIRHTRP